MFLCNNDIYSETRIHLRCEGIIPYRLNLNLRIRSLRQVLSGDESGSNLTTCLICSCNQYNLSEREGDLPVQLLAIYVHRSFTSLTATSCSPCLPSVCREPFFPSDRKNHLYFGSARSPFVNSFDELNEDFTIEKVCL